RELVRLMGGDLTVNSQEGEGAEFVFELPLHVVRDNPTAILYPGCSLLLLEPQDTLARIVSNYARFLGMACRRLSSLEEATPVLAQGGFDLVLADICYLPQDDAGWLHWQAMTGVPWGALTAFGEAVLPPAFAARLVKPVARKEFTRLMGQLLRQRSASAVRPASRQIGRPPARPHFRGSVLLVEDNLTNQEVTQGLLQLLGCRVRVAGNGEEALACVEGEDFDLILMDCQMPVMDGLAASRELRRREQEQHRSPTAIIALTANSFAEDRQRCLAAGMNGFLPKPFNESDLVKLLQDWLGAPEEGNVGVVPATLAAGKLSGTAPLLDESVLEGIVERQGQPRAEFLGRFIATFLASATTEVDALVQGTSDAAAAAAHSLKSAAANVGAGQLADLARVLEAVAREGSWDSDRAREAAQRLPEVFAATRAALEQTLVRDAEGSGLEQP
ncbi:MAG TPA: response regulator, partial [Azospira sp.]|nr:response regulator [Azospira sp.]